MAILCERYSDHFAGYGANQICAVSVPIVFDCGEPTEIDHNAAIIGRRIQRHATGFGHEWYCVRNSTSNLLA